MTEMTMEEAKELIGSLVDSIEESVVLSAAYKVVLSVQGKPGWEREVEDAQEKMRGPFGEVFLPLRELLAGTSAVQSSDINWHQIVQKLIESANDIDLSE